MWKRLVFILWLWKDRMLLLCKLIIVTMVHTPTRTSVNKISTQTKVPQGNIRGLYMHGCIHVWRAIRTKIINLLIPLSRTLERYFPLYRTLTYPWEIFSQVPLRDIFSCALERYFLKYPWEKIYRLVSHVHMRKWRAIRTKIINLLIPLYRTLTYPWEIFSHVPLRDIFLCSYPWEKIYLAHQKTGFSCIYMRK